MPKVHGFPPTTIAFSHDSTLVVSGSADNTVHILQLPEKFNPGTVNIIFTFLLIFLVIYLIIIFTLGIIQLFLILIGILIAFVAVFYQFYLIE